MNIEEEIKNIINRIDEWLNRTFSPNGKKIFLAAVSLLIISCIVLICSIIQSLHKKTNAPQANFETVDIEMDNNDTQDIEIEIEPVDDNLVDVDVEDIGRNNPFLPDDESQITTRTTSYDGFSLMAPPENLYDNSEASKIVTTKVSGIMYDSIKPYAILNIEGMDYVVRPGDYINNYKVLTVSKDLVTVKLGKNIYKAGVGQIITEAPLKYNEVYDLQHRFGGAKK